MGDLTKSDIEDIIIECINDKASLKEVIVQIKSITDYLSDYDHVFIEHKYCDLLIDRWLAESEEYIKCSTNPHELLGTIQTIKSVENLSDCCNIIGNCDYNNLISDLNQRSKLLNLLAKQYTHQFKKVCLNAVILQTNSITSEIAFVEECLYLIKNSKDPNRFCSDIQINEFLDGQDVCNDFRKFLCNLPEIEVVCRDYAEMKRRGNYLSKENSFYLAQGLKETIQSYLEPVIVLETFVDGRVVLEVSSKYIILSRVLSEIEQEPRFSKIEEVRFVRSDVIHIDANFVATIWHGKNIVIRANSMIVSNSRFVWDVSGKDGRSTEQTEHENKALAASDGNNGESGGNVMIIVDQLQNGENLEIISKGGNGSRGMDGRRGEDGAHGMSISCNSRFKKLYPPVSTFKNSTKYVNLKETHTNILECIKSVDCLYHNGVEIEHSLARQEFCEGTIFEDSSKIENVYFEVTTVTGCKIQFSFYNERLSFCQSFLLYKGSVGTEGKPGQCGGKGGKGGFGGEIDILVTTDNGSNVSKHSNHGLQGHPGKAGASGIPGKCGLDKGYMDCTLTVFGEDWPKFFFPQECNNSTLTVKYTDEKSSKKIWAPHLNKYAEITESRREFRRSNSVHSENSESSESNLKENCSRKKTISLERVLDRYGENNFTCNISELCSYVSSAMTVLDDNFSGEEVDLEQSSVEVKVTQKIALESYSNVSVNWFDTLDDTSQMKPGGESSKDSTSMLILQVEQNLNDFSTSKVLINLAFCVRMSLEQLSILWRVFDSSKDLIRNQLVKSTIKNTKSIFFCDKYKLAVFEDIESREFHDGWTRDESIDVIANGSSLVGNTLVVNKRSCGRVATFFVKDSPEKRDEVLQICENFSDDECFKSSLKVFVREFGNSLTTPIRSKELLKNQLSFEEIKVAKLKQSLELLKNELMTPKNSKLHQILIESIIENNGIKLVHFQSEIKSNIDTRLLTKLFCLYCKILKTNFTWLGLEDHMGNVYADIKSAYFDCITHIGINSRCYRDFLALYFDTNIMIYSRNDNRELVLEHNHNGKSNNKMYLLKEGNTYLELEINKKCLQMTTAHVSRGKFYSEIMLKIDSLTEKEDFDAFLNDKLSIAASYNDIPNGSRIVTRVLNIMSQDDDVKRIKNAFASPKDKILLGTRLNKLKFEYSGYDNVLHFMGLHFKTEDNVISSKELCFIINIILKFSSEDVIMPLVSWIIAAYPHSSWLVELSLLKLETYFKMSLEPNQKVRWRGYLTKQNDSEMLMFLNEKINDNQDYRLNIEHVEEVLSLISNIPRAYTGLEQVDILEWKYHLKDKYWAYKVMNMTSDWSKDRIKFVSYYLISLENKKGAQFCNKMLSIVDSHKHNITEIDKSAIETTLKLLTGDEICIHDNILDVFSENQIRDWPKLLRATLNEDQYRSIEELVDLIHSSHSTTELIKSKLDHIVDTLREVNNILDALNTAIIKASQLETWVDEVIACLRKFTAQVPEESQEVSIHKAYTDLIKILFRDIKEGGSGDGYGRNFSGEKEELNINKECLNRVLVATVIKSIDILLNKKLRETQKLSILTFLMCGDNILSQFSTGEGKSLIVVSIAIIKSVLSGHSVDVITSSNVLAKRDAKDYKEVYSLFKLGVGNNCSQNVEERKKTYSNCNVVYGELASFQRDFLLDRFYGKNILGDRKFELIIVDEVDSMLLDQSNSMLYLSHEIPGLDKLQPVFVFIWKWLNMPTHVEGNDSTVLTLSDAIRFDLFGIIKMDNIRYLDTNLSENQVLSTWEYLLNEGVIDNHGHLLMESIDENKVTVKGRPYCIPENHFRYLLEKVVKRNKQLHVPNNLKPFVNAHLDDWINSAVTALRLEINVHYVVDVNRSTTNTHRAANIIILDHHTGTDMVNSHWDEGLHQFLELKHGCRLSPISLKAVFKSNVSYFKQYKQLYGLTGTLGSDQDRQMLKEMYSVEFVTVPTAKPTKLIEYVPQVHYRIEDWLFAIIEDAFKLSETRSVLIVCETIKDVSLLEENLKTVLSESENQRMILTYKRDYELVNASEEEPLIAEPGHIIISTNLAGRGTDIKLSEDLKKAGGLHVCLTFLPTNSRIEEQAYGRVARNGEPGSSQLIIKSPTNISSVSKIIDLKNGRDSIENTRISSVKQHYDSKVRVEEELFDKFKKCYESLKDKIKTPDEDMKLILLQDCLDQWAFWLDHQSSDALLDPIDTFLDKISKVANVDIKEWPQHLKNPSHLLRLGVISLKMKNYKLAISFFNQVIKNEPSFSETAYYYRPLAKAKMSDSDKDSIICDLKIARNLFKTRVDTLLLNAHIIDWLKDHNTESTLLIDSFKEQQEDVSKIYMVFIYSIDTILGTGVDFQRQLKDISNELIKSKVISKLVVKKGICEEDLTSLEEYGIKSKEMILFLNDISQVDVKSFRKAFPLPSREIFWKELIRQNLLIDEQKYVYINMSELDPDDPLVRNIKTVEVQVEPSHKHQVWIYEPNPTNTMESYSVCRKHVLVDKIGINIYNMLKSKGIFQSNKRATLVRTCGHFNFKHFNSISYRDFKKIGINNSTTADILDELLKKEVLVENKSTCEKQFSLLLFNVGQIECIELKKCKAYSEDVKSLLKFHFSFGLAMNELANISTSNENLQINLKKKLHKTVINILIEHNIIQSVVNPDSSRTKKLKALWRDEMSTEDWQTIFTEVYGKDKSELIISDLIRSNWLVSANKMNPFSKYKINTSIDGKIITSNLSEEFQNECATIKFLLEDYLNKLTKVDDYESCLNEAVGLINTVGTPDFHFKPLRGVLQMYNQQSSEISQFTLNGLDQLLQLGEKTWTFKMKVDICIATLSGLAEVAVGSFFFCQPIIMAGIDDLIYCVNCMFTGTFNWRDYAINKIMLLMQIFKTPLLKLFSNNFGKATSFSVQSLKSIGSKFMDDCFTQNMLMCNKGEVFKSLCTRVMKAVGASVISNTFHIVQCKIEPLGKKIIGLFDQNIEETLESHRVTEQAKTLYHILGKIRAKEVIDTACSEVGDKYQSCRNSVWNKTCNELFRVYNLARGVLNSKFPSNLSDMLDTVNVLFKLINKVITLLQSSELRTILYPISHFLDMLEELLQKQITVAERSRCVVGMQQVEDVSSEDFSLEISFQFKVCIKNEMSILLTERVIGPLLCRVNDSLVHKYIKVTNNTFCKLFSNKERALVSKLKHTQFTDQKSEVNKKSKQMPSYVDQEYDRCLLQVLKTRKNNAVFAEMLMRNTEIDVTCLDFCCYVIPAVLKKHGINVPNLEIVVDRGGFKEIYKTDRERPASLTIHISTNDGLVKNLKSNKVLVKGMLEALVFRLLPSYPQILTIEEHFLDKILMFLESHFADEHAEEKTMEGKGILSPENDSYQHLHPDGSWTLNPTVDLDIREETNAPKIRETEPLSDSIENHIRKGFTVALNMLNNHVRKVQIHLKRPFGLTLDDFNESKHDIFPPTSSDLNMFHGRAVEYELVMPFKVKGKKLTNFIITLKLVNEVCKIQPLSPHGPHIVYRVEPANEAKYMNLGVKGHVLLHKECARNTLTLSDCRVAGDLIFPTGFKLTTTNTRKKFDVLILGDSALGYIQDHIDKPSWKIEVLQNLEVETNTQSLIYNLAQCFTSFKLIYVHLGTSLVHTYRTDREIAQFVSSIVNRVVTCFQGAKVIMFSTHQRKFAEQRHNSKILRVNGHLKKYCELNGMIYLDTSTFIGPGDLQGDGKDLNKRGYKKIAKCIDQYTSSSIEASV